MWLRRFAVLAALVTGILALGAGPASAHTVGGVGATDFRTTLTQFSGVPGVELRVVENGSKLEVRDTTDTPVVVRGYQGEPYAKVGPDGVFVNENSPAYYLNADRYGVTSVPATADPKKAPSWRKISGQNSFRWHDHRTHWMQTTLPPVVSAAPDEVHTLSRWTITLDYGGKALIGSGTLTWVPGPAPWGWFAAALALLAAPALCVAIGRRWAFPLLAAATLLVVLADAAHSIGVALLGDRGFSAFVVPLLPQAAVWAIGGFAVYLLGRRRDGGTWAAAIVGVCVAVASGVPDLPVFWRSSAPTVLPPAVDRLSVLLGLGLGLGLLGALALQLLLSGRSTAAASRPAADADADAVAVADAVAEESEPEPEPGEDEEPVLTGTRRQGVSRRELVGLAGALGVGGLAGAGLQLAAGSGPPAAAPEQTTTVPLGSVGSKVVPFRGARQAGIATPVQRQSHARVAAFDLLPGTDAGALKALLQRWTTAAEALTTGNAKDDPTADSGPASLTITVGFGPSLFGRAGIPVTARPAALAPLPAFAGESLDASRSDGDLGVLVSADDAVVAFSALRTLERLAAGVAKPRWQFAGFTRGRGVTTNEGATVRNLMGQLDGTRNPKPTEATFARTVFADDGWMKDGSYLVVRRIRMLLDDWEKHPVADQEQVIGRKKQSGAPLSGGVETTPANFGRRGSDGAPMIAENSHIRLATSAFNRGAALLRRGYSFADPLPDGSVEAGLIFLAWQSDPRTGFIPVQQNLVAGHDRLGAFTRHETSALFAMPGGATAGRYLGQSLFEEINR
ncbi:Dyp-type peroxidase [Cryptosporangium sp. NPDC051539]|uniref:Dyp-type peroxidase n=1 Tax=Cryptosporangium sp. NPDC051539 TaxID=3363962 RepID=UPI0037B58E13